MLHSLIGSVPKKAEMQKLEPWKKEVLVAEVRTKEQRDKNQGNMYSQIVLSFFIDQ